MTTDSHARTEDASVRAARQDGAPQPDERRPGAEALREIESRADEAKEVLATGARAGGRAGALGFLALLVVLGAATYFYMTDNGGEYPARLDAELLRDAELALGLRGDGSGAGVAVAPSWPLALYGRLRQDIGLYAAAAAAAAYLWALSARARARRDAFLLHDRLAAEVDALRERVRELEDGK